MEEEGNDVANSREWNNTYEGIIELAEKDTKQGKESQPILLLMIAGILIDILKKLEDK